MPIMYMTTNSPNKDFENSRLMGSPAHGVRAESTLLPRCDWR
jgi:hypothetical protein